MNLFWIVPLLLIGLVVCVVVGLRLARPHSRKKAEQQSHLNEKAGKADPKAGLALFRGKRGKWIAGGFAATLFLTLLFWLGTFPAEDVWNILWARIALLVILSIAAYAILPAIWPDREKQVKIGALAVLALAPVMFLLALIPDNPKEVLDGAKASLHGTRVVYQPPRAKTCEDIVPRVPCSTDPQGTWPTLAIPANGDSERIPTVEGMHIEYLIPTGSAYAVHIVYGDPSKEECVSGIPDPPCPAGDVKEEYLRDTRGAGEQQIPYAFAPNN